MRKIRPSEEQIAGVLNEPSSGQPTARLCSKHEIGEQTLFGRLDKWGRLEVSEAQWLRQPEDQNRRLKQKRNEQPRDIVGFKAVL